MDKKEKAKRYRLMKTYGLTLEEWRDIVNCCDGACWLCNKKPKKSLHIDHRHVLKYKKLSAEKKRKEVRGGLCMRCNKFTVGGLEIHKNAREVLNNLNIYFSIFSLKGDL